MSEPPRWSPDRPFLMGANLPWLDYGCDFGANEWQPEGGLARPERQSRLRPALGEPAAAGAEVLRWFLLADGRAGLRDDETGTPLGLDEHVWGDVDACLEALRGAGLGVIFVLTDFLWFRPGRTQGGVRMGGRGHLVRDPGARAALRERVVVPLLRRYGHDETIVAWDVLNEPEWASFGVGTWDPFRSIPANTMRQWLGELVADVHEHTIHPATVGSAGSEWLDLVRGLERDFYQVHWYDAHEAASPLDRQVASLGLDRPLLLGEYPTRGSVRSPETIVQAARLAGYAGALGWSVLAEDTSSDRVACTAVLSDHSDVRMA